MSWKQDRTPNLDDSKLTVSNDGSVLKSWCGWCLAVAETALGTPRYYANAFTAWQNAKYKHVDRNWPLNVYFVVFYSWVSGGINYGHIAIAHWDGTTLKIWSAPYTNKPYFDYFENDLNLGGHYGGISYLGWTEDLATVRICHYEADPVPTPAPAPVAKYQVVETYSPAKQVKLNKQPTYLWGMNYDFDYMVKHPVETHNAGEIWAIDNKVLHQDGSYYYRRAGQIDGFNVVDCDDYTPPAPAPDPTPTQDAPAPTKTNTPPSDTTPPKTPPAQEPPKTTTGPAKPVVVSVPPKVVVPEPHLYYTLWQLFVAIIKKLFGAK